jgi:hypothetical protein
VTMGPETGGPVSELDEALGDPLTEAKFQGLKRLNTKKVAKLMAQIDLNQSELTDMKVEGKDNVRTRIIQGLKKKIGYHETVMDYLKHQLITSAAETENPINPVDIDEVVMRKTIGGPKRFRPVGRVQIEKKITELEKKIKGVKTAKEAHKDKNIEVVREDYNQGPDAEEKTAKILRIKLSEENAEFQRNFEANNKKIEYLTELLQNLRNRSSQSSHSRKSASNNISEAEYNKMKSHNDDMSIQLDRSFADLAVTEEEVIQCKADSMMALEHLQLEHDRIVSLTQKSSRQNEGILRRMADLETELDRVLNGAAGEKLTAAAFNKQPANGNSAATRCQALKSEIKKEQEECVELEKGAEVTSDLKESIRVKNDEIRELRRAMNELARLENKTPTVVEKAEKK